MTYDLLFSLVNASVMPAWALLIFAPKWSFTDRLVHSMFYPLLLGAVYIGGMVMAAMGHGAEGGGFTSIEGVRTLFSTDVGMIIGWTHFLVFDLFVGAWEARDAQRRGFKHWMLVPCLLLTFMLGPIGLFLYLLLRKVTDKGRWSLAEG
ncbi:ABA4-like family protein [Hellea balneolensis]|uniref:ABA4-like family protein n=1 Tax=Hellea balneolensis TaxID=287478 RepID=UPI0004209118|nr:ABA4-like family protein [Hellea balneolensis]